MPLPQIPPPQPHPGQVPCARPKRLSFEDPGQVAPHQACEDSQAKGPSGWCLGLIAASFPHPQPSAVLFQPAENLYLLPHP